MRAKSPGRMHRLFGRQAHGFGRFAKSPSDLMKAVDWKEGDIERSVCATDVPPSSVPRAIATMNDAFPANVDHPGKLGTAEAVRSRDGPGHEFAASPRKKDRFV